jgi:hypothetical protein
VCGCGPEFYRKLGMLPTRYILGGWRNTMSQRIFALFMVLMTIIMASAVVAHAQSSAKGEAVAIASSENSGVQILGLDSTSFPKIKINIFINKLCAMTGDLKQDSFKVKEDGNDVALDRFYFTGNASGHKLDFALVFDDTGSMGEEISAMKSKVQRLTDQLKSSGIDARYALVTFKDSYSVKTNWTSDPAAFKSSINSLQEKGGNDEPETSLDAIEAVLAMGFRSDAQKVVVVITDAHAHYKDDGSGFSNYTKEDIERDLKGAGAIFIPLSPTFDKSSRYVDLRDISNDIQSTWIDLNSAEFSTILEQIQGILTGTYVIEYKSPDLTPSERTVLVSVDKQGCVDGSASSTYIAPGSVAGPQGTLSISGRVFNDSNGDGVRGADEAGLEGWDILLLEPGSGSVSAKADRNGYYIFTGLIPGSYKVVANVQENWTATAPETGAKDVELVDVHVSEIDFGFKSSFVNQTPTVTGISAKSWLKIIFGYVAHSVHYTNDGGYVITATDGLIKTDSDGNELWVKQYYFNGTLYDPEFFDGQRTSDVGYIITGRAQSNIVGSIDTDVLLLKTDEGGNQLWNRTFGGDNMEEAHSVQQCLDGGYIITGNKGLDLWLVKTDADGNLLWDKTYGGDYKDEGNSVQQTIDGGYIITGTFDGNTRAVGSGDVPAHLWLIKTDADGNLLWNKTYGSDGMVSSDGQSVQQTIDGGYIATGSKGKDLWLIKTDSSGVIAWDKTFSGSDSAGGACVQQTRDEGYIITGSKGFFEGDLWLIKTDADGNLLWDKTFGRSDIDVGESVQQTIDGGYIITGWSGQVDHRAILIKTDENGNVNED